MIDFNMPTFQANAKLLLQGMWYSDLPDLLEMDELATYLNDVIIAIENGEISAYKQDSDGLIVNWKSINSPSYIRSPGVEAISYFEFKKNKSLREMQIPNLLFYISFIYNTLFEFSNLFEALYIVEDNRRFVQQSNSYLVFGDEFVIFSYDGEDELATAGIFTTKNTKINSSAVIAENKRRLLKVEAGYLYSLKMDIESFFPNLYTHNFEKMAYKSPFSSITADERYFKFLDSYHQRINNNQTKGIPGGVFSSHVAAELCMLCVDQEINEYICSRTCPISYVRYVDDLTFFSDSESELNGLFSVVQSILNKYRLRINGNKTESFHTVYLSQPSYINEIENVVSLLKKSEHQEKMQLADFFEMRKYIASCLTSSRISQIRTLLSMLNNRVVSDKLNIDQLSNELFNYVLKLAFEENTLVYHTYRLLDTIMQVSTDCNDMIESLLNKRSKVDNEYSDTLLQIWYYYLLFKYADARRKETVLSSIESKTYNPLVLASMVSRGKGKNKALFNKIRETYIKESNSDQWKNEIMYSKWWLPLFKISRYDTHNYDHFMRSENFPKLLQMFCDSENN